MEIGMRDLWTVLHGMGFGALYMLALTGAIAGLFGMSAPGAPAIPSPKAQVMPPIPEETEASGSCESQPVTLVGTEAAVLRLEGGNWQVVHIHWSSRKLKP